jgi:hypothetical protein
MPQPQTSGSHSRCDAKHGHAFVPQLALHLQPGHLAHQPRVIPQKSHVSRSEHVVQPPVHRATTSAPVPAEHITAAVLLTSVAVAHARALLCARASVSTRRHCVQQALAICTAAPPPRARRQQQDCRRRDALPLIPSSSGPLPPTSAAMQPISSHNSPALIHATTAHHTLAPARGCARVCVCSW